MKNLSREKNSPLSIKTIKVSSFTQALAIFTVYFWVVNFFHPFSIGYDSSVKNGIITAALFAIGFYIVLLAVEINKNRLYKTKLDAAKVFYFHHLKWNLIILTVYIWGLYFFQDRNLTSSIMDFVVISIVWAIATLPAAALIYSMNDKSVLKKEAAKRKEKERLKLVVTERCIASRLTWVGAAVIQTVLLCLTLSALGFFLQGIYPKIHNLGEVVIPFLAVPFLLAWVPLWMGRGYVKDKKDSSLFLFKAMMIAAALLFTVVIYVHADKIDFNNPIGLASAGIFFLLITMLSCIPSAALLRFMPGINISKKEATQQKKEFEQIVYDRDSARASSANKNPISVKAMSQTLWDAFEGFKGSPVKLYGQEKTEVAIARSIESFEETDGKPLSLLFCGASGVGKTQMVENLAIANNIPMVQFNMPEYSGGTNVRGGDVAKDKLLGMPAGYTDSARGGLLTNELMRYPTGIFLFDEMEKASPSVYDIFLNALDRGFIDDARGNRVDCSKATFIFTTNIARDVDPELEDAKIRDKMVREGFRPELVGRLHRAIVFRPLSEAIAGTIAKNELQRAMKKLADRYEMSVPNVVWHPEALALRASIGTSGYEKYGVRVIAKTMKELAMDILNEYKAKKLREGVVLYPAKHSVPNWKVLKGGMAFAVGIGQSIDTKALFASITKQVKGQDHAVNAIMEQISLREMGLVAKKEQPEGTYLFTGPSGTGKSELVKQLAKNLGRKFVFFNMGNFKGENGIEAFFGPPPGYLGSEDGGQLTNAVLDNPDAIILLDEIEKANPMIWDAFMSVFDDGVAKDNSTGEMVSFKNTMIFMTSNLVTEDVPQSQIRDYLRGTDYFRPEMINRIENIVSFKPLGDEVKCDIVAKILANVLENYNKTNGTDVKAKAEWLERFTAMSDFTHGARDIQRMIQKELAKELC